MDSSYLVDRHISNRVGITNKELTQAAKLMGEKTLQKVNDAYQEAKSLNVTYHQSSTDINEVKRIVIKFVEECNRKSDIEGIRVQPIIVLDYLGMAKFDGGGLRTYGIGDFVNGMKQLINKTGASACLFSQINRSADEKDIPSRADFSDSQSIENASDNLILIHRPEYNRIATVYDPDLGEEVDSTNKMLLRVFKCRDFGTGDKLIGCDIKYYRFYDLGMEYGYEYWNDYNDKEFWKQQLNL